MNIKSIIVGLMAMFGVATSSIAADDGGYFNAKELSVSIGSSYVADYHVDNVADAFAQPYDFNLTAGAQFFPYRNFGFEVNVPFYQTKGVSVSEVNAGLLFRLPLSKTAPVLKSVAPYVGFGGSYNWDAPEVWTYVAKAGVEWRLNSKWGLFTEAQYRNAGFNWDKGATAVAGGIKLVF